MRDYVVFNGVNLSDYHVYISNAGVYRFPQREIEKKTVPGRSGDLIFENDRFKNVNVRYPAIVIDNFDSNVDAMLTYLLSIKGYARLEDTFRPDYYRMATFTEPEQPKVTMDSKAGTFVLPFDCKPQLYLKAGEDSISVETGQTLYNPTNMIAKPLIRAYGAGSITIGNKTITINSVNEYVDIDCDLMDAHKGSTNCNANISGDFPVLNPGENVVTLTTISSIDITPRFWTL